MVHAKKIKLKHVLWRFLSTSHPIWSKFFPNRYVPYRFDGGRIYLNVTESPMMLTRAFDCYEITKMEAVKTFLPGREAFIDAGANKGDFSLLASRVLGGTGRVIAFEPEPDNCRWIRRSIRLNGYHNIDLHELALSDQEGEATFYLGQKSGWHSLVPKLPGQGKDTITVKTQTLDRFLDRTNFLAKIGMIKIDVEGAEMKILRGASQTLAKNEGIVLLIDAHPRAGVIPTELCDYLHGLNFSLFQMTPPFDLPLTDETDVTELMARRL